MPKIDSYSLDTSITDTDSLLGVNAADGKTKRYAMSAIKTALLEGADITEVNTGNGLSGGATSGAVTLIIDTDVVTTLTGSQTLTNKTLTTPVISSISNSGTITLPTSTDTLVGKATTDTLTNKTLTSPTLNSAVLNSPTYGTTVEAGIANGDYLLFLDATDSSITKKEGLDDIAAKFAEGTGLSASSSQISVDAAQTGITSVYNSSLKIGYSDSDANIDFSTDNAVIFDIDGTQQLKLTDGVLAPITDNDIDLGTSALEFKDGYFDGTLEADAITIGGTNVVTGSLITTLGTISAGTWNGTAIDTAYLDTTLTSQTSILNSSLVVGRDAHNQIDFSILPKINQNQTRPLWAPKIILQRPREHQKRAIGTSWGSFGRSEERRVGKECRSRWSPYH